MQKFLFVCYFWLKKVDFWIKIAIFILYKTSRVPFGYQSRVWVGLVFTLNSRVWDRAGFEKTGFGYQSMMSSKFFKMKSTLSLRKFLLPIFEKIYLFYFPS